VTEEEQYHPVHCAVCDQVIPHALLAVDAHDIAGSHACCHVSMAVTCWAGATSAEQCIIAGLWAAGRLCAWHCCAHWFQRTASVRPHAPTDVLCVVQDMGVWSIKDQVYHLFHVVPTHA
jgi:hypothetical protein